MTTSVTPSVDARWQAEVRAQFPILTAHPDLVYLDSAATSQKPIAVLEAADRYLRTSNANAGRGTYEWANATTVAIEAAKETVGSFIGASPFAMSSVELVSGTTEGLHRIAFDWLLDELVDGDEIIVPTRDHQANVMPWFGVVDALAARGKHITAHAMPYDSAGDYDVTGLATISGPRTRFVAMTHVHHVYGADMGVKRVRAAIGPDAVLCLDAAQSIGHLPVSMTDLDVDFAVFSGHKAMALPGIGAIWARNERGRPFALRGWGGTPNTVGAVSLSAGLDWLARTGIDRIEGHLQDLTEHLETRLLQINGINLVGCPHGCRIRPSDLRRVGIVAFRHERVDCGDLGFALDSQGFMVRSNTHCQAGMLPEDGSVRVSMHAYTTATEIDRLVDVLEEMLS